MRRCSLFLVLAASVAAAVGCGFQPGQSSSATAKGGLAVIDLDEVAKVIGRTQEINNTLAVQKSGLDNALQKGKAEAESKLLEKQKEFGEAATDEQKQELAQLQRSFNAQLVQGARNAQTRLEQSRQQMIALFRAEIKPIAQQIAMEKGLGVVIPKNEGFLLAVDPGVDITGDVIKAYHQRKPVAAPSSATAAQAAPAKDKEPARPAKQTAERPSKSESN